MPTITVSELTFQELVLSAEVPVLVDFWADWCAPCKSIAPVLEKIADEYGSRLTVAKVNVDEEQQIAAALGIRSLPTMMLFVHGRPVDQIIGAQPEANIRAVVDRYVADSQHDATDDAAEPEGDATKEHSLAQLEELLEKNPDNLKARLAIARIKAINGELDAAEALLGSLTVEQSASDEARQVSAALEFARLSEQATTVEALRARLVDKPGDLAARLSLGACLVAAGDHDAAAEQFLDVVKRDKQFDNGAGRRMLLRLFDLLGPADPRITGLRRRMMSALY